MAQALESANAFKKMAKNRDPSLLIFRDETELYLIDRRFSTTTYGDISGNIICKLVYPDSTISKLLESVTKEVEFQNKAAKYNLGPKIYEHGFSEESIPFTGFYEYDDDKDGETKRMPFHFANPFYYITMEYYSKKNGWKGPVYVSDAKLSIKSNNDLFYDFIYKLIFYAEIANILDPIMHFYYHPVHGLRMIDYGRCIDCKTIGEKQSALNEMMKSLEIKEKGNNHNRSYKRPNNRNRNRSSNQSRNRNLMRSNKNNSNHNRKSKRYTTRSSTKIPNTRRPGVRL
jgi:hypothetical protein